MTSTKGATERDGMIIGGGDGGERIEERNRRRWRTERLMGNEGSRQREREKVPSEGKGGAGGARGEEEEDVEAEGGGYHGYQKPQSPPPTMREVSLTPGKATAHQHAPGVRARTRTYTRTPRPRTGTCEGGGPRHYKHALRDTACEVPFRSIAAAKPTLRS